MPTKNKDTQPNDTSQDNGAEQPNDKIVVSPSLKSEHGGQVHLTGQARAAARGGLAGDMMGNLLAKTALEADGTVADGTTPDGTTHTGIPQPDDLRAERTDDPAGSVPATRVEATGDAGEPPKAVPSDKA